MTETPETPRRRGSPLWKILRLLLFALIMSEALFRVVYFVRPDVLSVLNGVRIIPFVGPRLGQGKFVALRDDPDYQTTMLPGAVDAVLGFGDSREMRANVYGWKNDRAGFRSAPPADGQASVVALGDSFTFCVSDEADCWVNLLSVQLGTPILNLGVTNTGSRSHASYYRDFIADPAQNLSAPKLVLWQFFGNDYNDDFGLAALNSTNQAAPRFPVNTPLQRWLTANSALYAYFAMQAFFAQQAVYYVFESRYQDAMLDLHFNQRHFRDSADMRAPQNQEGEVISHAAILETRDRVEAAGGAFVLIAMPYKEEVYRAVTEPLMGTEALNALAEPRQRILAFCAAEKLRCFDPLAALQAATEQVYYPEDIHLNPAGNRVLAEALAAYLREAGIGW